jgi:hypothetical protein
VFRAKYRRAVFDGAVDKVVRDVCLEIERRYQMKFLEIGSFILVLTLRIPRRFAIPISTAALQD